MGYHSLILAWGPFPFPPGIYYSFLNRELISPPPPWTARDAAGIHPWIWVVEWSLVFGVLRAPRPILTLRKVLAPLGPECEVGSKLGIGTLDLGCAYQSWYYKYRDLGICWQKGYTYCFRSIK